MNSSHLSTEMCAAAGRKTKKKGKGNAGNAKRSQCNVYPNRY